jgi:hypothetical protein
MTLHKLCPSHTTLLRCTQIGTRTWMSFLLLATPGSCVLLCVGYDGGCHVSVLRVGGRSSPCLCAGRPLLTSSSFKVLFKSSTEYLTCGFYFNQSNFGRGKPESCRPPWGQGWKVMLAESHPMVLEISTHSLLLFQWGYAFITSGHLMVFLQSKTIEARKLIRTFATTKLWLHVSVV